MAANRDVLEWLRMMERFSPLADCKPQFALIAAELAALRAEVAKLRERPAPQVIRDVADHACRPLGVDVAPPLRSVDCSA